MTPEAEDAYCDRLGERFLMLRGAPLTVSPLDYELLLSWARRGIPEKVVAEALVRAFRKPRDPSARPLPLAYAKPVVEEAWQNLVEMLAPGLRDGETIRDLLATS